MGSLVRGTGHAQGSQHPLLSGIEGCRPHPLQKLPTLSPQAQVLLAPSPPSCLWVPAAGIPQTPDAALIPGGLPSSHPVSGTNSLRTTSMEPPGQNSVPKVWPYNQKAEVIRHSLCPPASSADPCPHPPMGQPLRSLQGLPAVAELGFPPWPLQGPLPGRFTQTVTTRTWVGLQAVHDRHSDVCL